MKDERNPTPMLSRITTAILLALCASTASAQSERATPIELNIQDLIVANYTPQNTTSNDLYRLASSMIGREFFVAERGGVNYSDAVQNMALLGNQQIVLYDTDEYIQRMLLALEELDVKRAGGRPERAGTTYTISHFRPRYLSLDSCYEALKPLTRIIPDGHGQDNIGAVPARNTIVLRDTKERLAEMEALLQAIDVPEDQVVLTCYLLQGRQGGEDDGNAPKELVQNLKNILPNTGFQTIGFAMLQSGVSADRTVTLSMDSRDGMRFMLSFTPVAFDRETSSISARRVKVEMRNPSAPGANAAESMLSTDTIFRGNQYTVLGATGQEPLFVVVHVTPGN